MKKTMYVIAIGIAFGLLGVVAMPTAQAVVKTDGFVCPVFNDGSQAGAKNPNAVLIGGGDFSVIGPDVSIPINATNGNGAGSPGGAHFVPGDNDYTAIWAG